MLNRDYFGHYTPEGVGPEQRDSNGGYQGTAGWENIDWEGTTGSLDQTQAVYTAETHLFVDSSEPGRGHRLNLLNPNLSEVGPGIEYGTFHQNPYNYNSIMVTQDFGTRGQAFLTGVMYQDLSHTHFYAPGEGIQGGIVTATNEATGQVYRTTTGTSGGYAMPLPPGIYNEVFTTPTGLRNGTTVAIGNSNVKEDLIVS
jgi:hypothetical protein